MDAEVFAQAAQIPIARAEEWHAHVLTATDKYHIRSTRQLAAFITQVGYESMGFQRWVEKLNYATPQLIRNHWPFRFKSIEDARHFVRRPEKLANHVYANRLGNGDEASGDGWRYHGRGLLHGVNQFTGKDNYRAAQRGMKIPLLAEPELLQQREYAASSAAWWWHDHNLNLWADREDIDSISGIIDRGDPDKHALGQDERRDAYVHALHVLEG